MTRCFPSIKSVQKIDRQASCEYLATHIGYNLSEHFGEGFKCLVDEISNNNPIGFKGRRDR